jgi:hypothetical protein
LPETLRNSVPPFTRRIPSRATYDDAVELARYDCRFPPGANEYNAFIAAAMA